LQDRIDALVDSLLGLLLVMGVMSLSIPLLARIAILAALPLGLYALVRGASTETRRASAETQSLQPTDAMFVVPIKSRDPAPHRIVPASYAFGEPAPTVVTDIEAGAGRNDSCWCGSGKKFKKCHGA
jgi:uncharacterized protein YecA (UPF0149 family)